MLLDTCQDMPPELTALTGWGRKEMPWHGPCRCTRIDREDRLIRGSRGDLANREEYFEWRINPDSYTLPACWEWMQKREWGAGDCQARHRCAVEIKFKYELTRTIRSGTLTTLTWAIESQPISLN